MQSNIVQFLGTQASDDAVINDVDLSSRRQVETFLANGTIAAGDWVTLDYANKTNSLRAIYVITIPVTADRPVVVGVALESVTAGQRVQVVVKGYVEDAHVETGTVAAGGALAFIAPTVAGRAEVYSQAIATMAPCGYALEAGTGDHADVFVCGIY